MAKRSSHRSSIPKPEGKLIALIGDEDTCLGFMLSGIGEVNATREPNFLVVNQHTRVQTIRDTFIRFKTRNDIAIILITHTEADKIRETINMPSKLIPVVLEIPTKDHPYDIKTDSIIQHAKGLYTGDKDEN